MFRESFQLRDVGGEGGEFFSGRVSECVRNIHPTSEGALYCVCIFLRDSIKCISQKIKFLICFGI